VVDFQEKQHMDSLGFGLFMGAIVVVILIVDAYRRGRRAGLKLGRQLHADPHDMATVTRQPPWTIVAVEVNRMHLVNVLRDACTSLDLAGFLTRKEADRISARINEWQVAQMKHAEIQGENVDKGPF
jgi:hypothetical protein